MLANPVLDPITRRGTHATIGTVLYYVTSSNHIDTRSAHVTLFLFARRSVVLSQRSFINDLFIITLFTYYYY